MSIRHGLGGRCVRSAAAVGASGASGADERLRRFWLSPANSRGMRGDAAAARGRARPGRLRGGSRRAHAGRGEALRESEAKVRRLVDSDIMGVFEFKVEWKVNKANEVSITEANEAFLEMVGHDREDLAAGRLHWSDADAAGMARCD